MRSGADESRLKNKDATLGSKRIAESRELSCKLLGKNVDLPERTCHTVAVKCRGKNLSWGIFWRTCQ
jgi:hypothetical protein